MIIKDDFNNRNMIDTMCYCKGKHCSGEIIVKSDNIKEEHLFMITVIDSKGGDESSLWLTPNQLKDLADEISILLGENN